MSREHSIKWRRSDEQELKRVVKNFNSKLSRILKKNPEIANYLPERLSYNDLKESIQTRKDFNRKIKSLERFNSRKNVIKDLGDGNFQGLVKNQHGVKITLWEKKEVGIQVAVINRERTRKRKMLENQQATSRGKSLNMTRKEMNSVRMNELKPKKFIFENKRKSDWEDFKKTVEYQSSPNFQSDADLMLRENYIKGLIYVFGETNETKELIEQIKKLPLKHFINKFYTEQEADIDFIYDPIELERKFKIIKEDVWNTKE